MQLHQRLSARLRKGIAVSLVVACAVPLIALVKDARVAAQTPTKLEATIFAYDGKEFVRTQTTLLTKEGQPAVNTKLDHDTPAYGALIRKRSYSGEATVFGRKYDANYAPLTSEDGRLTGALFVAVAK
jgi:hypothetical protein